MRWVSWNPPATNRVVVNVDGSSMGNPGRAGFGGLIRNYEGDWICGFAGHFGISNNIHMELLAVLHGLKLAWSRGFRSIECRTDRMEVLNLLKGGFNHFHLYASIIASIVDVVRRDWSVMFSHTLREGNQCADFLAKKGACMDANMEVFESPPPGLSNVLLADSMRVPFPRF
ncbi:hypothetical protein RIF29_22314 [Crotalaria pallida]|uniref:RNase H type-1 domain-containing protein n=1 Tax=Crotalaria pallida TaxID=3830 RepID=A0AAN9F442_CROPI